MKCTICRNSLIEEGYESQIFICNKCNSYFEHYSGVNINHLEFCGISINGKEEYVSFYAINFYYVSGLNIKETKANIDLTLLKDKEKYKILKKFIDNLIFQ